MTSAEMGRRGSENTGSELMKKKIELQKRHDQLKKELEKIKSEVETLERLAANSRKKEVTLTSRLTHLRERAAVLREQRAYQQTSIDEMERGIASAERKISLQNEELNYFTGNEEGGQLTSEEIVDRIENAITKKGTIESAISNSREKRNEYVKLIDEKATLLRTLRESAEKLIARLNVVTVGLSRLEVKYEAITYRLLNEYGLYPDFNAIVEFDEKSTREKLTKLSMSFLQ